VITVVDPTTPDTPTPADLPAGACPLPGGQWAVLADWHTAIDGKAYKKIMGTLRAGAAWGASSVAMREAIVEILVTNWSLPFPLPATAAVTDMLSGQTAQALLSLPEVNAAYSMINGSSVRPTPSKETMADPASPTEGSGE
jgi:hypothetical protein